MKTTAQFLREEFQRRKQRNSQFSLRAFARWLQISPAQLSQILSGKRPVTVKTIAKIARKLDLSPAQQQRLLRATQKPQLPQAQSLTSLREDQFRLISDWYHLAILSLTRVPGAKADPRWISARLGISVADANLAVQTLMKPLP